MRNTWLSAAIFFISVPALSEATLCLQLEHQGNTAKCTVTQFLKHSDFRSFWECQFSNYEKQSLATKALGVGFNYDRGQGFSDHKFSISSALGKFLFGKLGLNNFIVDAQVLRIFYGADEPWIADRVLVFTDSNGVFYKVDVSSLKYGPCT